MDDPTQIPPFYPVAVLTDGVVTGWAGTANQHWIDTHADPNQVLAPGDVQIGDTYTDGTFQRPATQPTQEAPDA